MLNEGGQEPPTPEGYARRDRISAGIIGVVLLGVAALLIDIASDGRVSALFGGSPVEEAERIAKEAVT